MYKTHIIFWRSLISFLQEGHDKTLLNRVYKKTQTYFKISKNKLVNNIK